ncbi:hypothetical protein [Lutibaculum baratangense]|uniref:Outer membrane protein beta-barrel domain-containing protein n=1 Tax=Lutibaculum baratangense AMV1 TaxID=631454 RepID=V4RUT8_9HYPH|nr:hypothetical protein [Lutibaculum baratangense]ESR26835.1 hypothetical protein N177_0619 [Lutibaculum baratangense AMV1]
MRLLLSGVLFALLLAGSAAADNGDSRFMFATEDPFVSEGAPDPNGILLFGGRYTLDDMGESFPWSGPTQTSDYFLGGALARDMAELPAGFVLGAEAGLAARFGSAPTSIEVWGGARLKHHGLVVGDVNIAPAVTLGVSATTNPLAIESIRERSRLGSTQVLAYFTPEISLRLRQYERAELVYRLQHRSGAFGLFGGVTEGANANALGVRWRF